MKILFICIGNSCRSIMAEALLRQMATQGINAQSAGIFPAETVHPLALEVLGQNAVPTEGLFSKSLEELEQWPDIAITLYEGADVDFHHWDGVILSHWPMHDPFEVQGNRATRLAAYVHTLEMLRLRINKLLTLPLAELSANRPALQNALDGIGHI